ncbi:MAG: ATP-binding protein [Polyangiaceae bacterium]
MSDSDTLTLLKAKATLLIQREREIFQLRLAQERIGAWLQAFRRLSARAPPESGEAISAEWTAAMIEERHFQTAVAFRHDVFTGGLALLSGQSHTRLPEKRKLDEAARRALRERRDGLFERSRDSDCVALARCLGLRSFVWFVFSLDERYEVLLAAGVAEGIGGAQVAVTEEDLVYFTMIGRHFAALWNNQSLISALRSATQNVQELFDHMKEAIVAFDPASSICGASSRQAKVLFERENLEGCSVRDLLYPGAAPDDVDAASFSEWVDLAFHTPPDEWASCACHAPRDVFIASNHGAPILLELEFRPLVRDGAITHLMLLASDVSAERRLEEVLQTHEAHHAKQLAAMRRLIAGGPQVFIDFIDSARARINRCEAILREHAGRMPTGAVDELFRQAHTIRGEARAFDLLDLESAAKDFEDALDALRNPSHEAATDSADAPGGGIGARLRLVGEALDQGCKVLVDASPSGAAIFDQATVPCSALRALTEYVGQRPDSLGELVARLTAVPFGMTAAGVMESAPAWAALQGIQVALLVEPRELMVPQDLARVLPGVLTHLVKNAIAHGIEPPEERRAAGKPEQGTVRIVAESAAGGVHITVEDDGRGLNVARISEWPGSRSGSGDAADVVFEPGLSTRNAPDALAGRGVGLDAVRRELALVRYEIKLTFASGQWTRLILSPKRGIRSEET